MELPRIARSLCNLFVALILLEFHLLTAKVGESMVAVIANENVYAQSSLICGLLTWSLL